MLLKLVEKKHVQIQEIQRKKDPKFCASPPTTTATLTVIKQVIGGTAQPSDFNIGVNGNNPSPSSFPGSSSGTTVTIGEGEYIVGEGFSVDYSASFSSDCFGTISAGQTKTCTITNTSTGP
jgi:hypothetical protein